MEETTQYPHQPDGTEAGEQPVPQWHPQAKADKREIADADSAAISSLITAFVIPPLGIIFGHVSRGQAKRRGLKPSAVADLGMFLGYLFTLIWVIVIIVIAVAAAKSATSCDPSNPAWPYC